MKVHNACHLETRSRRTAAELAASAFALFAQKGFDGVSLDEIAAHAGVTKGSLYWHFNSKRELIHAACGHYYRMYQRRINDALAGISDPGKRLEQTLRVAVRTCLTDEANRVFTMEIFTWAVHDPELRRSWQQFYDSVREFYIGLVKAASLAGAVHVTDPEHAVNLMLAAMEGIKLRALFEPGICSPAEEARTLAGLKEILGFKIESTTE
ncbi:MAG: TetR/AcrR family transcriptional regulator [Verrucomicrobiae bacterium]|nr:TetR/AcrR family transcriptional regulator [Verrucomicrobiae bacterium]